jgi:hypothetical protein
MKMRVRSVVAGMTAVAGLVVGVAGPAHAGHGNGSCEANEVCLYWGNNQAGAFFDFYYADGDHRTNRYVCCSGRQGYNEVVADNAQSAWNRRARDYALIAELTDCQGSFDVIVAGSRTNLEYAWNNNWSNCWTS